MIINKLTLIESKTEVIIVRNSRIARDVRIRSGDAWTEPKEKVRNLGAHWDARLSLAAHINNATGTGYYHLRRIAKAPN